MAPEVAYCSRCVIPSTKPHIRFDAEGVCNACRFHEWKRAQLSRVDWDGRREELARIFREAAGKGAPFYDVVVPVSGGKDSFAQVDTVLQHRLRVLAVHVDVGIKTEIGRRNLDRIGRMGVPMLIHRPEPGLERRLTRIGFEDYGDPYLMSHSLLYAYPMWAAVQFQVPLVLWGENSAWEYGGEEPAVRKSRIDRDWFLRHVVTGGVTVEEISRRYGIPASALVLYDFPEAPIQRGGTEGIFLGHFLLWDSESNLKTARQHGFETLPGPAEGTFRNYVALDDKLSRVHQYMKVIKFGYGRATDHACEEIRNGRMTREEAIALVMEHDGKPLSRDHVEDFCKLGGYSEEEFWRVIQSHCNPDLCRVLPGGALEILAHRQWEPVTR